APRALRAARSAAADALPARRALGLERQPAQPERGPRAGAARRASSIGTTLGLGGWIALRGHWASKPMASARLARVLPGIARVALRGGRGPDRARRGGARSGRTGRVGRGRAPLRSRRIGRVGAGDGGTAVGRGGGSGASLGGARPSLRPAAARPRAPAA